MLTYKDCIGLCALTDEEVRAIAIHEHVPDIIAMEIGQYIIQGEDGVPRIRRIILDDIEQARDAGNASRADKLEQVLRHFIASHPEHRP